MRRNRVMGSRVEQITAGVLYWCSRSLLIDVCHKVQFTTTLWLKLIIIALQFLITTQIQPLTMHSDRVVSKGLDHENLIIVTLVI